MAHKDPEKAKEYQRRWRAKKHAERYGEGAGNMVGKHGNHARGDKNGRFNSDRLLTSHGYVLVRVEKDHPHEFGPAGLIGAYAYEHVVVLMEKIGRPLADNELSHHKDGNRQNNAPDNLELKTRTGHAREHANSPGIRDGLGRFMPGKPRPICESAKSPG